MAILKKQPTKKCDSDGNIINIVHEEKEEQNVHEGGRENFTSENPDYFDNENLEFKLVDVSDNISEIQIKNEIDEKIIITPIQEMPSKDPLEILNEDFKKPKILEIIQINTDNVDNDKKSKPLNDPENYKCDPCGKVFYRKSAWKNHNYTFHEKMKEKCDFCPKIFSTKIEVNDHIKKIHETDDSSIKEKKNCLIAIYVENLFQVNPL